MRIEVISTFLINSPYFSQFLLLFKIFPYFSQFSHDFRIYPLSITTFPYFLQLSPTFHNFGLLFTTLYGCHNFLLPSPLYLHHSLLSVKTPQRVTFVEDLSRLLTENIADLWKLGQTYLSGKLYKEVYTQPLRGTSQSCRTLAVALVIATSGFNLPRLSSMNGKLCRHTHCSRPLSIN